VADFSDELGIHESFLQLLQRASSTFNPFLCDVTSPEHSETEAYPVVRSPQLEEQERKEIEEIKQNPMQVNSVWKGTCSEFACEIFDMTMHVTERVDEKIKGEILWSGDVQTKFRGTVVKDVFKFEEYKVTKGICIIPFPNSYVSKVDLKDDTIAGKWFYNDQQGRFQLSLDVEATKTLLHSERPEEEERDGQNKVIFESMLSKQTASGIAKKWQHRHFALQGDVLRYSKSKEFRKISGEIPMSHVISVQETPDGGRPNQFDIIAGDRTYHLLADHSEVKAQWIEVLRASMKKYETPSIEMYNI